MGRERESNLAKSENGDGNVTEAWGMRASGIEKDIPLTSYLRMPIQSGKP